MIVPKTQFSIFTSKKRLTTRRKYLCIPLSEKGRIKNYYMNQKHIKIQTFNILIYKKIPSHIHHIKGIECVVKYSK